MYQNGYLSLNSYTMTASSELTLQIWNSTYHNEIILQEMYPMKQTWLQKLHANENTYAGWERERERAKISVTLTCTSTTAWTAASGNKKNNGLTTRAKQKNLVQN